MGFEKVDGNVMGIDYWDKVAQTDEGYYAILSADEYKIPDNFWNAPDGLTPELWASLGTECKFLDLGCGYGRLARHISPKVKEYHGVDYSKEMVAKAIEFHKDYKNVYFHNNNGQDLSSIGNNSFNIVYSILVFQHMHKENTLKYIREVRRILVPGGTFFAYCIPRKQVYSCGLDEKDLNIFELFRDFKVTKTKYYYNIIARN